MRRRIQAPIGNLLALLVPRWRIVPAIPLEYISNDPAVVRAITFLAPRCPEGCCWGLNDWQRCFVLWGVNGLQPCRGKPPCAPAAFQVPPERAAADAASAALLRGSEDCWRAEPGDSKVGFFFCRGSGPSM